MSRHRFVRVVHRHSGGAIGHWFKANHSGKTWTGEDVMFQVALWTNAQVSTGTWRLTRKGKALQTKARAFILGMREEVRL